MTDQERLLRKIRASQFAMWELHIFLDTHPRDCGAEKRLAEYERQTKDLIDKYEDAYGPMNDNSRTANRYAWVQEPWPWENAANKEAND